MKILIVDDDPVTRSLLKKQISGLAECSEAENGKAAIEAYLNSLDENRPFQIITLDIMMPDMDGQTVLEAIRKVEREKKLARREKARILMISSRSDRATILACVQLGCDDYIAKPFERDILLKKIKRLSVLIHEDKILNRINSSKVHKEDEQTIQRKRVLKETIFKIADRIRTGKLNMPVPPMVLKDIRAVIGNPFSTIKDLEETIRKDAVVSLRVITESNSPFFGSAEKINSLEMALQRLGYEETINVVNAIISKGLYSTEDKSLESFMEKFWIHSLASAHAAKAIAEKLELADTEKYFFMGIIHDIGKVLLLKALGDAYQYDHILDIDDIMVTIRELHAGLGGAVIKRWGLSDEFVRIAIKHPGPHFDSNVEQSILVVNLASYIADYMGYGIREVEESLSDLDSARLLKIDEEGIKEICDNTKQRMIGSYDLA